MISVYITCRDSVEAKKTAKHLLGKVAFDWAKSSRKFAEGVAKR